MRTSLFVVAILGVTLATACGSKKDPAPAATGSGGSGGSGTAPTPAAAGTKLYVDDNEVAIINAATVATWPRLDGLLPEAARRLGTWQAIHIKNGKPAMAELNKPFETYRDYVPALFPGENGTVSFGMFDAVELGKKGKPALREDGVLELHIKLDSSGTRGGNDHGGGEAIDPAKAQLVIKTAKEEIVLSGEKMLALPREAMPGGGGDAKGWRIQQLLEAAGVKTFKKLMLIDAGGTTLPLEAKDLDASTIPFIKLNRSGAMRFRLYKKQGDGWQAAGDLRALAKIEVLE